jgi:geranylgeranyl reductase family protein
MATYSDIIVLGAGPGGATTCLTLARQGQPVLLLDKARFPRDKVCGDALSGKVVDTLRKTAPDVLERLAADAHHLPCWGVQFVAPSGTVLEVPFRQNYQQSKGRAQAPGYIARREDFDHFLLREALASGSVDFRPETSIRRVEAAEGGYLLETASGEQYRCRLLIAADGAQSVAAKTLAARSMDPRHHSAAVRVYYRGVRNLHPDHFIELHYLSELVPGYFWIFPLPGGRANVGLGLRSDQIARRRLDLKKELARVLETHPQMRERFAGAEAEGPVRGFGLPLGSRRVPISGAGYFLVGDAACLIDPFTGEGIGNAMISGRLAALQALECLKSGRADAAFCSAYDEAVYRHLGDELRLSYQLQRLASYPRLFNFVVRKAAGNPVLRETISCMFEDLDMRERLRHPGFYFRLLFARNPA